MKPAVTFGLRGKRPSLVVGLACVLIVLLLGGHDLRPLLEPGHDHSSAAIAGLCAFVLSVLVPLIVAATPRRPASVVPDLSTAPLLPALARPLREGDARASPAWLQRFRN